MLVLWSDTVIPRKDSSSIVNSLHSMLVVRSGCLAFASVSPYGQSGLCFSPSDYYPEKTRIA